MLRIHAHIGADQSYRNARQPRVRLDMMFFFLFIFIHHHLSRLSPRSRPPVQDNCERIPLLPAFTTSRFLSFLRTLGNDDRRLAAVARHQYALNTIFSVFHFY